MCSPEVLASRYLDVIRNHLGLEAEVTEGVGRDVVLRRRDLTYVLVNNAPDDPEYLELHMMLHIEDRFGAEAFRATSVSLTRRFKSLKVLPAPGGLLLVAESVVAPPKAVPGHAILLAVLPRFFDMIDDALAALQVELEFQSLTGPMAADLDSGEARPPD